MNKKALVCMITDCICGILLAISAIMQIFWIKNHQDKNIWIFENGYFKLDSNWLIVGIIAIIIIACSLVIFFFDRKNSVKSILIIFGGIVLGLGGSLVYMAMLSQSETSPSYYRLHSGEQDYEILAEETSILLNSKDSFYLKNDDGTYSLLGFVSTDDGFTPIKNEKYGIKWEEDSFTFSFSYNNSGNKWYSKKFMVK